MLKSDLELKNKVLSELPSGATVSKLTLVNSLREWCYQNVPVISDLKYLIENNWTCPLYQIYNQFENYGFICGGHALFLCRLYQLFGFKADCINYGYPENGATHCMTLVDCGNYGNIIQDSCFNNVSVNSYEDIVTITKKYGLAGINSIYFIMQPNNHKKIIHSTITQEEYQKAYMTSMTAAIYKASGVNDFRAIFYNKC